MTGVVTGDVPRVVLASGGTLETALLPGRLLALRQDYALSLGCALTRGATDLVSRLALSAITGRPVYQDHRQLDERGLPLHLTWRQAEALVVHPASARLIAECALGSVTDAVTRLVAFTPKDRIAIAPAVHPDMDPRPYRKHLNELRDLGCTILGGEDLHAPWSEVEAWLVSRLALVRQRTMPGVTRLDHLARRSP
ncbi:MAG: hypothetical protein OHK0013_32170 [Sandaracinaceae bacterium]